MVIRKTETKPGQKPMHALKVFLLRISNGKWKNSRKNQYSRQLLVNIKLNKCFIRSVCFFSLRFE